MTSGTEDSGSHRKGLPRILLVEDNPGDARLLEAYLEEAEFSCDLLPASSLSEALAIVGDERLDLCLLDLGLPDSEGVETVERFRDHAGDLPIVVLTGLDDLETAIAALRAGAEEYLVKDAVTPWSLGRTLRFVLERTEARQEREVARERWGTVFEVSPVGLVISDADSGRLIEVNDAFVEMFGQPRDELLGSTSLELGQWDDPDRRAELVRQVKEEGGFRDEEAWYRDAGGRRGRMLLSCRRLKLAEGDRLLWTVQDVTERVQRERALEESTRALAERVKEQSCLYDISRILHEDERSLDRRLQDLVDRTPAGWQYPEVTAARLRLEGESYTTGGFEEDDPRLTSELRVEGERIGDLSVGYTEERPEEEIGPFLEEEQQLLEEVAGRVAAELEREQVRRQHERLVKILENTSDFVGVATPEGGTFWINQPGREMLGIPEDEELRDVPISAWSPDWAAEKILEHGLPRARERGAWEGETALLTREGEEIPVSQVIIAHGGDDGEPDYYSTIARDICDRKESEDKIRRSEARYRTLVETMAEATVILSAEGRITFANSEAERLLGLERSDLSERTYDDPDWKITTPGGGPFPESELPFRRVMDTGKPVHNVEHAITRPDGTRTILSVNAAPLGEEQGEGPEGVVATMRDITEQKQLEAQLEHQALHDPLTGLANRTLFEDRLKQALARSHRQGKPMGLMMLDIDAFKRINDSLGHTVGDHVLEQVARRLDKAVRDTDTVARWGGDEFVVVLPELDTPEAIEDLQTRLRQAIGIPFEIGDEELEITVTVGGVVHTTEDVSGTVETQNPEDMARFADLALHRAKDQSPGGFYQFNPTEELDEIPDLRVEQDLRRGLDAGEIKAFYQPIYRLDGHTVWGFEALARWQHPERGLVSPAEFIPLAEKVGLIHELGDAVCQQSCRQVAAWNADRDGRAPLKIAVNLSAHQLQDPNLTDRLRELMEGKGISPDQVVLEVTETAMMKTVGQARKFGALGVNLFIDDFGTGYSTFTYLRELDVQGLKLDTSLVQSLPESESDAAIVESMVTLADRLGLLIVAEGIETQAQLDTLRELGCHFGQGFFLGRPAPADQIEGLLPVSLPAPAQG